MMKSYMNQVIWILLLFSINITSAQKNVILNIKGKLGASDFALNNSSSNNMGNKFTFTRLDLLISGLQLHHDGTTINLSDKYIFIKDGQNVELSLGEMNIENLDSITFSVGVDPTNNHADPSLWHSTHPLAPKSPDMHWGWASGYRFIAVEGNSGDNAQYSYQIHSLGDELYKPTTIVTNGQHEGSTLHINIKADYSKAMENIKMNKNIIKHGSTAESAACLVNFNKLVFSEGEKLSSTNTVKLSSLKVYPNITINSQVNVELNDEQINNAELRIIDNKGRLIKSIKNLSNKNIIQLEDKGIYNFIIVKEGMVSYTNRVVFL